MKSIVERLAIPEDWRARDPKQVVKLAGFWLTWLAGGTAIHALVSAGWWPLALLMGLLLGALVVAGIGFIGHDVCHGSVVSGDRAIRVLAFVSLTSALFVPYRLWIRWHNTFHHRYANSRRDSDRLVRIEELESGLIWYRLYALANLCGFSLQYVAARMWRIVYANKSAFTDERKRADVLSLGLLASLHLAVLAALPLSTWVLAVAVPIVSGMVVVSYYIQSNHFLRPQSERVDPVKGSTDVSVPRIVDFFHSNFSCHTAHHVFPAIASIRYPAIRERIEAAFPDDYLRVSFLRAAWDNARFPKIVARERLRVSPRGDVRLMMR